MIGHLDYASRSIRGKRKYQEDCCDFTLISDDTGTKEIDAPVDGSLLAVLADGMGGHVGGGCASRTLCAEFIASYVAEPADSKEVGEGNSLSHALEDGNQAIHKRVQEDESLSGMGSTFIGAVFDENGLNWISVGDSLLYLYRNGKLNQLNENHAYSSVLQSMVKTGEITETEAGKHPHRNALLSAVTGQKIEKIDQPEEAYTLEYGDWVLLASDGILTLPEDEISSIIASRNKDSADDLVEALVAAVQEADYPRQDNTTIMAVYFGAPDKNFIDKMYFKFSTLIDRLSVQRAVQWVASGIVIVIIVAISLIFASSFSDQKPVEQAEEVDPIGKKILMHNEQDKNVVTRVPQR